MKLKTVKSDHVIIGVISDTHGLLRAEALEALQGAELILHAGDIGPSDIIEQLRAIAPVRVVRGNCDHGPWAQTLPETEVVSINGRHIYVIHDIGMLDLDAVLQRYITDSHPRLGLDDGALWTYFFMR